MATASESSTDERDFNPAEQTAARPANHVNNFIDVDALIEKEDPGVTLYNTVMTETGVPLDEVDGAPSQPAARKKTNILGKVMPSGGFASGVFNLAGSSLGAGILALPSAFHTSGIIMGTIYLIIIFLLTVFSVRLLAMAAQKTGIRSYEGMARDLFGRGGDIFTAVIMFVKCIGACIAYVICISDLWSAFLKDDRVKGYCRTLSFRRVLTSITFLVLMLPLSLPKSINSLRYVSLVGVTFILYFVVCIVVHSATHGLHEDFKDKGLELFTSGNTAIHGLGMYMFAYLCQSNMFEVWNEMKPRTSVKKMEHETFVGMLICTCLYWFAGFFGYADFGSAVASSLLKMYAPLTDYYFAVAYIGLIVKFCVAFALHILPCRDAVHHLIGWKLETIAWWKNALLCTFLSLCTLICGLFIPNVNIVFSLLGSFTGGFIGFVFPSLFFMYAGGFELKRVGWLNYFGALLLLVCGVIIICFGTTSTIYSIVASS